MVGGHKKKIKSIWETQHLFGKFPPCIVPILFLASCDENPEESWYFFGCPDGQPTQELGSRDPFGQYLEVGRRGCEYCSLGSRFNTLHLEDPSRLHLEDPSRISVQPASTTLQHVVQTTMPRTTKS